MTSTDNLTTKDYSRVSKRKLNKLLKLRAKQIAAYEGGRPTTEKRISQLRYEHDLISSILLELAMTRND